jgi:hypothetical protein
LQEKFRLSKDFNWTDNAESFKIDSSQSAQLKSFESQQIVQNNIY